MEIRRASVQDAPGLAEQISAVADEGRWIATESGRPIGPLIERFESGIEEGHLVFVLEHDERIVGGIGIQPTGIEGVHSLGMSVLDEFRGQGWGRRLVDTAVEAARAAGVRKVVLEVFADNGRALALYATSGFEVEGVKRNHYLRKDGSLRSAILMARFLETV
jgi:putative acetyltransferase